MTTSWWNDWYEPWREQAACRDVSTAVFFPHRGDRLEVQVAKHICASCPVRSECLDFALASGEKFGVWGGRSERARRRLRRATSPTAS